MERLFYVMLMGVAAACAVYWLSSAAWALFVLAVVLAVIIAKLCYDYAKLSRWILANNLEDYHHFGACQPLYVEILRQKASSQKNRAQLQQNLKQLESLVGAMPLGLMIVDAKGVVEWANRLAMTQFDVPANKSHNLWQHMSAMSVDEGVLHKNNDFLQWVDDLPVAEQKFTQIKLQNGHQLSSFNVTLVSFQGRMSLLMSEDVSEKERFFASKTDFVANVSHELRTPLTVIQGFLETMAEYELDKDEQAYFVGLMQEESTRMLALINDLMVLSRLENTENDHQSQDVVDLSAVCQTVVSDTHALNGAHGDTHIISANIEEGLYIHGSDKDMYSALSNLAFNAIWHTPAKTTVTITLKKQDKAAIVSISDTGDGIDEVHLPRLTERFYRVDKGRVRENVTQGSGLGLAIVKHALALHNATLHIESTKGIGTRFWTSIALIE